LHEQAAFSLMALRIITLVALVQCSVGNVPTGTSENLNSTISWGGSCPGLNAGKFKLNYNTKICMDIALNGAPSPFNGARVQVWHCTGGRNQEFIWCSDGSIVSAMDTNMCLDVPGGNPFSVKNMQMWTCNGQRGQIWSYDSNSMAIYNTATPSRFCLDTAGGSTTKGTSVVNYYYRGSCTPWYAGNSLHPGAGNSSATDRADIVLV